MSRAGTVKATVDAVFQDGVFKPSRRPDLPEGEHVRITVERVERVGPGDILQLAARVYEGLSTEDIDDVEAMARRRPFFSDARR